MVIASSPRTAIVGAALIWAMHQALAFTVVQNPTFMSSVVSRRVKNTFSALRMSPTNSTVVEGFQIRGSSKKNEIPTFDKNGPVFTAHSVLDFLNFIENAEENELVVVKYHAKWCKICARANVKYKQTAIKYTSPDTQHPVPVKFVSVESSENMEVIKQFGIKRFPFIQIYRNMECVASFGTGPAYNFKKVVESTVDEKLNTPVSEWDAFRNEFKNEISQGLQNLDFLRLQAGQAAVDEECDISVTSDCVSP